MKYKSIYTDEEFHIIENDLNHQLFVVNGSKLYDIELTKAETLDLKSFIDSIKDDLISDRYISNEAPQLPQLSALSLNVAQGCNLSCGYCYADEGKFQKHSRLMEDEIALSSIDRLFEEAELLSTITIGFMGGEPLLNRKLLYKAVEYSSKKASLTNKQLKFSITTNGTILREDDIKLFRDHPFNVTISIDGHPEFHNLNRKTHSGKGSYEKVIEGLNLFEKIGRPKHLSARSTVTPLNRGLVNALNHLIDLKFDDVGFSPVLVSPNPNLAFSENDFENFLVEMIECGNLAMNKIIKSEKYPFSNFETALFEIHRGTHRPYPCGAGAGYMSVNAEGDIYACHRLIDDKQFYMGDIFGGLKNTNRNNLLNNQLVDKMEPCKSCWARYLCGGGCYHEVKHRGRIGCDYIRGWLTFCISAYKLINDQRPSYFNI